MKQLNARSRSADRAMIGGVRIGTALLVFTLVVLGPLPAAATGTISGLVVDRTDGTPLPCEVNLLTSDGDWVDTAYCDVQGIYQAAGLPAGDYLLIAGVPDQTGYVELWYDGVVLADDATPVTVRDGQTTGGIDFQLWLGGRVSGVVRDSTDDTPVSGAWVSVYLPPDWLWDRSAETGEDGSYQLAGIPPGTYHVHCWHDEGSYVPQFWDHASLAEEATPLVFTATEQHDGIDFDLLPEAVISGQVIEMPGRLGVAGAYVEAHTGDWSLGEGTNSAADGTFRIGLLPPGTYFVWAGADGYSAAYYGGDDDPTAVVLDTGEQRSGVEIILSRGGAISGQVLRTDGRKGKSSGVAHAYVYAWRPSDYDGGATDADENGRYRIDGLPAATYFVTAEGPAGVNLVPQTYADAEGNPIAIEVVVDEEVSGIDIVLPPGGTVAGTVRSTDKSQPLADIEVWADQIDGDHCRNTYTAADGTYQLDGLAAGSYVIAAEHPDHVFQAWDGQLFFDQATPVLVRVGEAVEEIDFLLSPAGIISGRVVAADTGEPIGEVSVGAFLDDELEIPAAWVQTESDGTYRLGSVLPGENVFVLAVDWSGTYAWGWYSDALLFAGATPVVTWPDQPATGIDLALARPGAATLSASELQFSGQTLQENIPAQQLVISNPGPGPTAIGVWNDGDWLWLDYDWTDEVLEADTSLPVAVAVCTWGLNAGTYRDRIHVYDYLTGREQLVEVTLTLTEAAPLLEVTCDELWFAAEEDAAGPAPEWLYLANLGGGQITYTASVSSPGGGEPWLAVAPATGVLRRGDEASELQVTATTANLAAGSYSAVITLATSAGDRQVAVWLDVEPASEADADLQAPGLVTLEVPASKGFASAAVSTTFELANHGAGTLYWSARLYEEWLALEPASGAIAADGGTESVLLTVDPSSLSNGMTSTFVEIASSTQSAWIEVRIRIGDRARLTGGVGTSTRGQLVIPVVVHAPGAFGSQFVSDLWISYRPSGSPAQATIAFIPFGASGAEVSQSTTLEFASGETISLLDIVANWLDSKSKKGSLVILSDSIDGMEASSRTYNERGSKRAGGFGETFGQHVPGLSSASGIARLAGRLHVAGLQTSDDFRSNLILTEVAGQQADGLVKLLAADGTTLGSKQVTVQPFAVTQINDVFAAAGFSGSARGARAEIEVIAGDGRLVALGSVVDNDTNDPTTILGVSKDATTRTTVVPVVANTPGVAGTSWISDVVIANVDRADRQLTITYRAADGRAAGNHSQTLAAGKTLQLSDVVGTTFGLSRSRGSLAIEAAPVGGLVVTSRTYNQGAQGTFGQGITAVAAAQGLAAGSDLLRLIALHNTGRYRTNMGVTELAGEPVRIGVALYDQRGDALLGYREVSVPAYGQVQANIFDAMGLADANVVAATAVVQVISGAGRVTTYASMVDNFTGDGTTLPPPQRVDLSAVMVTAGS